MMASSVMPRPTKCNICGKETKRRRDLGRHILTHSNATIPFYCKVPGCFFKGTPRKDNLRKHMRVAHGSPGQAPSRAIQHQYHDSYEQSLEEQETSTEHTQLIWWAERGVSHLVRLRLAAGDDPDIKLELNKRTPLHMAAKEGHEEIVRLLLDAGAAIHAKDKFGERPLLLSAGNGHVGAVELLLDRGADVNFQNGTWGETALMRAAEKGQIAVVRLLLSRGADVNKKDTLWWTPLFAAIRCGHEVVARLLLDSGADPHAKDCEHQTPLHWATRYRHEVIARLLLDSGADPDAKDCENETPLHKAASCGHEVIARLLFDRGADPNAKGRWGDTPMRQAFRNGHLKIATLLESPLSKDS